MGKIILLRGFPSEKKDEKIAELCHEHNAEEVSMDKYFKAQGGHDKKKVKLADEWCKITAGLILSFGHNVVVANPFMAEWEMKPFLNMAKRYGAEVIVLTCVSKSSKLHKKAEAAMSKRWEPCEHIQQESI